MDLTVSWNKNNVKKIRFYPDSEYSPSIWNVIHRAFDQKNMYEMECVYLGDKSLCQDELERLITKTWASGQRNIDRLSIQLKSKIQKYGKTFFEGGFDLLLVGFLTYVELVLAISIFRLTIDVAGFLFDK